MVSFGGDLKLIPIIYIFLLHRICSANDILGCGGFLLSHVNLDFSKIEIGLYTKEGSLKEKTECAPTNGYYFLPLYEKGEYILKLHPPAGWSFEPSQVELMVDGVNDQCSKGQDINFAFNGFGITGQVITAGHNQGPSGISVQLVDDRGDTRQTVTSAGGNFHFTPVIPGKYTIKASHPRWKLQPSQAIVQVREGNTALATGALSVRGYDVSGSVTLADSDAPVPGLYVLLYSKQENQKYRVEGCQTALLQGVPDAPICHTVTDASGEFTFGLVPAGEYHLLVLHKSPGQSILSFNVKPEQVSFTVLHNSLYIKKAFQVTGFTVTGVVLTHVSGAPLGGVQVALAGTPVAKSDDAGRYTLANMQPGTYTLSFQHQQCEFGDVQLVISPSALVSLSPAKPARWRVCVAVRSGEDPVHGSRRVSVRHDTGEGLYSVEQGSDGKWCLFVPPGVYVASVEVTEQERRDGLQYYPLTQKIVVGNAPVDGIVFSQLKATLTGTIKCLDDKICDNLPVTLRPLSPEGGYVGQPTVTYSNQGTYTFKEVLPGSVEVSVPQTALCWAEARRNVAVTAATAQVPTFTHTGYVLSVHSTHPTMVDYESEKESGSFMVETGDNVQCVTKAGKYKLTPKGCHRFEPSFLYVQTSNDSPQQSLLKATAHAVVVKALSPQPVKDLHLQIASAQPVGPITPETHSDGGYVFQHTLYMKEGELLAISARSSVLLFTPSEPQQVVGGRDCQLNAVTIRGRPALTLTGRLQPPVEGVTVTLSADDLQLSFTTGADGTYTFGPLDASRRYTVVAEKPSYVFGEPDDKGVIIAHKLAEIVVKIVDDADGKPLQGALVSVSGGSYRRNLVSDANGHLEFPSLTPAQYYVKPLMKEYRFTPPHKIVPVEAGRSHSVTLRGTRVAWSGQGSLVSLGGAGLRGVTILAASTACAGEEASTDLNGSFRLRGLLPGCVYTLQLKESSASELTGLKLVKAPQTIQVTEGKDLENIKLIAIQPHQVTDVNVLVRTPNIEHYKTLRLKLAQENTPTSPLYTAKLDHAGYNQNLNPGLMYVLPRLPADNGSYILQLESSLSKSSHVYEEEVVFFNSDGKFKHFTLEFVPKTKSADQELHQTSLLVVPLLGLLFLAYHHRVKLLEQLMDVAQQMATRVQTKPVKQSRADILDKASIDQIVFSVNAVGKKTSKKKQ